MTDLLYHHVKIKEGEPDYKKGELRYHYVKIEEEPKIGWEEPKEVKDYFTKPRYNRVEYKLDAAQKIRDYFHSKE